MKISSIPNKTKLNLPPKISFQGKMVNGHYYTDREYVDAMNYKKFNEVNVSNFIDRYGFFEYIFTQKAEKHVAEVNKCIKDLKIEEAREQAKRAEELKKIELQKQELTKKIKKIEQIENCRNSTIEMYTNFDKNTKWQSCGLSKDNIDLLIDEFFIPYAEHIADKTNYPNIPNGILIQGSDSAQNVKIIQAIASQLQHENVTSNIKQISFDGNIEDFQNNLLKTKTIASENYLNNNKMTIIYIPDLDKIALKQHNPNYSPELNSFLKVYMLDCAQNGCVIISTTNNKQNIESPFLTNDKRFGLILNLKNEE